MRHGAHVLKILSVPSGFVCIQRVIYYPPVVCPGGSSDFVYSKVLFVYIQCSWEYLEDSQQQTSTGCSL